MAVMDEFREEREQIRTAPLKVKWQYFKDYYLLWTLGTLLLIGIAVWFLFSILHQKEDRFCAVLVNRTPALTAETEVEQAFSEAFLENPKRERIVIDTSIHMQLLTEEELESGPDEASAQDIAITGIKYTYEDEEKLMLLVMTGSADLLVAGQDLFERSAAAEWYQDLRTVLDEETMEMYRQQDRLLCSGDIPIGVRMEDSDLFTENYLSTETDGAVPYAGVVNGCPHPEAAAAFLQFLQ